MNPGVLEVVTSVLKSVKEIHDGFIQKHDFRKLCVLLVGKMAGRETSFRPESNAIRKCLQKCQ